MHRTFKLHHHITRWRLAANLAVPPSPTRGKDFAEAHNSRCRSPSRDNTASAGLQMSHYVSLRPNLLPKSYILWLELAPDLAAYIAYRATRRCNWGEVEKGTDSLIGLTRKGKGRMEGGNRRRRGASGDSVYLSPVCEQAGRRPLPNGTEFINFSERDLINDDSSFCSRILLAIDLQRHIFSFEKLLLNVRLCL